MAVMQDVGEDGLMTWRAICGTETMEPRSPLDAIMHAETHVDRCKQ